MGGGGGRFQTKDKSNTGWNVGGEGRGSEAQAEKWFRNKLQIKSTLRVTEH